MSENNYHDMLNAIFSEADPVAKELGCLQKKTDRMIDVMERTPQILDS